ncbi:hypothetical protein MMC28_002114 [Mycoblastus sanguinarius]|nr:hypothetical protein [Mycoblastus sanguinarius]
MSSIDSLKSKRPLRARPQQTLQHSISAPAANGDTSEKEADEYCDATYAITGAKADNTTTYGPFYNGFSINNVFHNNSSTLSAPFCCVVVAEKATLAATASTLGPSFTGMVISVRKHDVVKVKPDMEGPEVVCCNNHPDGKITELVAETHVTYAQFTTGPRAGTSVLLGKAGE